MRIACAAAGLTDAWVEISEVWSRNDLRRVTTAEGPEFLTLLARKVTACYLPDDGTGLIVTEPARLAEEALLDDLDGRLVSFLAQALVMAAVEVTRGHRRDFFCVLPPPSSENPSPGLNP